MLRSAQCGAQLFYESASLARTPVEQEADSLKIYWLKEDAPLSLLTREECEAELSSRGDKRASLWEQKKENCRVQDAGAKWIFAILGA
jgi:hypothetical protein